MLRILRSRLRSPGGNIIPLGARLNPAKPRFSHSQAQAVRIHRVKFRRKRPKISSFLMLAAMSYAVYEGLMRVLIASIDEEDLELTEEERQELEEAAEEPFFIPFPGFTQMVEPLPYRGSDPEWQAYIKVSKDMALLDSIRDGLAEMARRAIANHPVIKRQWGDDVNISKYWLDVQYPLKPPPTFVRQGLSFGGGDGITWAKQPVDSVAVFWTRQALWPSALSVSLWSFTSALMTQNAMTIAKFFGYESQTDPLATMQQTIEKIHQQLKKQPGKPSVVSPPLPPQGRTGDGSTTSPLPPVDERAAGSTRTPEAMGTGAGVNNALPTAPKAKDMYMIRTAQEHTSGAWDAFIKSLMKKWRAPPAYPPRGSIRVSGLVEINTRRAIMTVDCVAWWDPQTKKYDRSTVSLSLRSIRPKIQSPLR
ncbi:hypothetical protein EV127DRAFT_511407 [Xylaria flabelliformis]|nr:hypothetical protein EV127DRAFT_511407 [Xylaria flabelliformis]